MTAPEPLCLTLEEALVRVAWQGDGYRLEPVSVRRTKHMPTKAMAWRAVHNTGFAKEFAEWESAAAHVFGRPVVARDDAAELRAALVKMVDQVGYRTLDWAGTVCSGCGADQPNGKHRGDCAVLEAEAILAASEGSTEPVVAHDDAAELRAALEDAHNAIADTLVLYQHALSDVLSKNLRAARARARAALAAVEGSEP